MVDIIKAVKDSKVKIVSLADLKKLLNIEKDNTAYKIAEKLTAENILIHLKKGMYASTFTPPESFEIANALYFPSYVSLESALSYYGILSQFPYTITSVTPKKSKKLSVIGKEYEYTQISKVLFFGFQKEDHTIIASPEKALLDTIYLASKGFRKIDFDELDYSKINKKKFAQMCREVNYRPFQIRLKRIKL